MHIGLTRLLGLLAFACTIAGARAGDLWYADGQGIHRIDTDTNVVARNVAQAGVVALTLDQKVGSLWATNGSRLFKLDSEGAPLVDVDLKSLATSFNAATRLALDPVDGSIWVAGGKNLARLDASGRPIVVTALPSNVRDLALAQDETLWVLGTNELTRVGPGGAVIDSADLAGNLKQAAMLALDEANGVLWLAGNKNLFQVAPSLPLQRRVELTLAEVASALALDPDGGGLWVAGQASLFRFDRAGTALGTTAFAQTGLRNVRALQFEPQSRTAWLGHEKGISRFDALGAYMVTLPATVAATAISSVPSGIAPIVTLVSPAAGSATRDAFAPISLRYGASCFGQPCGYPPATFASYVPTVTLNGRAIGGAFVFDPATGEATYTPTARHDEGVNALAAYVTDSAGRRSRLLGAQFLVDSIAPRFVTFSPPDGSAFFAPSVNLQGSIDDASGRVLLESLSGATFTGPNPAGASFSYAITLQPGTNPFRLTASDPIGNTTSLAFAYTYSTLTLAVNSPQDGATVESSRVTVTGTFSGAATATITVNGIAAVVAGNAFTAADVPLQFGPNTLTVVGVTPQGARATRALTVTSTAPGIAIASPAAGSSMASDTVLVTGQVRASAGAGVLVNGVSAFVEGTTFYANGVRLEPGNNTITATVRTRSGAQASASIGVASTGPAPVVVTAEPLEGATPLTVAFTLVNRAALPINSYSFSPGCAGTQVAPPAGALLAYSYPNGGTCAATLTLFDTAGNTYPQPFVIQARSAADLDAMFRALWQAMNDALLRGDKAGALEYLSADARLKYGPIFDKLMPYMPAIVASYSPLQRLALGSGLAEYAVNRTIGGTNRVFLVNFIQDERGTWVIDSM